MSRSVFARLLLTICAVSTAACASGPYYLVESRLVESSRGRGEADVIATPAYTEARSNARKIALQPPDACANQGVAAGGGQAKLAGEVLRTRCGVEMFELERALAKRGYQVISWSAIDSQAKREQMAPRRAAKELGVDVLLQINALEQTRVTPGRDARWERSYFHSNEEGSRGKPARVGGTLRAAFESMIGAEEDDLLLVRQGATINASAILVESGSAFWFYEATLLDADSADPFVSLRLFCKDQKGCTRVRDTQPTIATGPATGGVKAVSFGAQAADEEQVVYRALIRSLVGDLVESFASGS